ncbi:MAG TPA: HEAT repeat domain-containing protein, partial [Bryobacteraceae bacterium]|nr:HEAT repeat domain-containing protein [Bryobacteraceae bacterium]
GHAWLGPHQTGEQSYLYGFRGRMDERYDMVRSVRDQRYLYIRNYMPHRIYGQHLAYMFETPTTTVWKKMYDEGKLKPPQTFFWEPKPPEELYDLQQDRWEVKNLANSPEHQAILARLRAAQEQKALEIKDVGFLPEYEIHRRSAGSTPYEMGHDEKKYPAKRVIETAGLAASLKKGVTAQLTQALQDPDSAVRWWGALGILMRGAEEVKTCTPRLRKALDDEAPAVRIAAAEALGRYGSGGDLDKSLHTLLSLAAADKNGVYVALMAGSAINELGAKAKPIQEALRTLPVQDPNAPERAAGYMDRLLKDILADLK